MPVGRLTPETPTFCRARPTKHFFHQTGLTTRPRVKRKDPPQMIRLFRLGGIAAAIALFMGAALALKKKPNNVQFLCRGRRRRHLRR